jgi:hypothetical protein
MKIGGSQIKCQICSTELEGFKYMPMPEWDVPKYLCSACYSKKLSEYYIEDKEKNKG